MVASLFTAPLNTVSTADVNAFLDLDLEEGTRLDYKEAERGIPDTALKVIIAFANTYGGLLILGVEASKTTNRPITRKGIALTPGLEEALTAKCLSLVYPPLMPEIRICPFKSNPTQPTDDRAFLVVKVAPSVAAPHADKENHVYVRVNSQCSLADLSMLRFLFERQHRHEELTSQLTKSVRQRGTSVYRRIRSGPSSTLLTESRHICFEMIPLDAPTDILSFDYKGETMPFLDGQIEERLNKAGWVTNMGKRDGMLPEPDGLGIAATYIGKRRIVPIPSTDVEDQPISTIYFDRSGALFVDLATASLGEPHPDVSTNNRDMMISQLLIRLASLIKEMKILLREYEYAGRMQATIWEDTDSGVSLILDPPTGHRGSAVFSITDSWEDLYQKLGRMVSQMTRSWLKSPFVIRSWPEGSSPNLE